MKFRVPLDERGDEGTERDYAQSLSFRVIECCPRKRVADALPFECRRHFCVSEENFPPSVHVLRLRERAVELYFEAILRFVAYNVFRCDRVGQFAAPR